MKRNLVGKILGKIKIFVQDFVPIRTALTGYNFYLFIIFISLWGKITYSKSKDQPGRVANPARGQLNREIEYFPVRVSA